MLREIIAKDVKSRGERERFDNTDALFTGADRGSGVDGLCGGAVSALRESGGHPSWQKRQDSL